MAQETSLLTGAGADATGDTHSVPEDGWYTVYMFGTFDGTSVSVEVQGDNGTTQAWIPVPDTTQTSAWVGRVFLDSRTSVRAVTSGGTSPSVNVTLNRTHVVR